MRSFLLLLVFILVCFTFYSQNYPTINPTTVIPQQPTTEDDVLIVTGVVTPAQGHRVQKNFSIDHENFRIEMEGCYYSGALTATETHVDTFYIGKLKFGYYSLAFRARLSDEEHYCSAVDSNLEGIYINVDAIDGLFETRRVKVGAFYDPLNDKVKLTNVQEGAPYRLFGLDCRILKEGIIKEDGISAAGLFPGMYFIQISSPTGIVRGRFVKPFE